MSDTGPIAKPTDPDGQVCPHLALDEDRQTCMGYPSHWNLCHHCAPAEAVRRSHQGRMCLSPAHVNCAVYLGAPGLRLPVDLRGRQVHPEVLPSKGL
jgi:hypothetical protein